MWAIAMHTFQTTEYIYRDLYSHGEWISAVDFLKYWKSGSIFIVNEDVKVSLM